MSTRGMDHFQYTKNIAFGYRKTRYCYLAFLLLFHFSAIFFHVDSCESYATSDQDERQKAGKFLHILIMRNKRHAHSEKMSLLYLIQKNNVDKYIFVCYDIIVKTLCLANV